MMKVLLAAALSLMMSCLCAAQSVAQSSTFSQGCSIPPQDAAIIAKLHQPEDVRQPEAERQAQKLAELRWRPPPKTFISTKSTRTCASRR